MRFGTNTYVAIIDDDERDCSSLGRLMRAAGLQAISYSSAEMFLRDEKRPQFDCLILDVHLPEMSGIELQQFLIDVGDSTPIIFITAQEDFESRTQAERAGCVAYFRKTAPGSDVLAAIRDCTRS